jgi:radical SAM protein with 4Fe4S-binding SPASM domain
MLSLDAYRGAVSGPLGDGTNGGTDTHFDDPAVCVHLRRLRPFQGARLNGWHSKFGCLAGLVWIGLQPNGDVTPCPLLNIPVGNILRDDLATVLEMSPVIRRVRNRHDRGGRCGTCDSRLECGGCRAHAHATSGDYLAEDPFCVYVSAPVEPVT